MFNNFVFCVFILAAESHVVPRNAIETTTITFINNEPKIIPHIRHFEGKKSKNNVFVDPSTLKYCPRPAKCEKLNTTTCLGAKLPYHSTTLELTDLITQEQVQEKLKLYENLRFIPKCWAVIQPFLCALYMPKCEGRGNNSVVHLPSREMCRMTLGPCKILYNSSIFPQFLNCEDERLFPSMCRNDIHELKFNTTGYCLDPLVKTDKPEWFYPDVEGCGLRCKDSLYTDNEHYQIHKLLAYCVLLCILFNLFTIITFIIDWNTANKYPALAIFYVNVCFCISYAGWLIQFLGTETREDVVCKKDGTLRKSEPSASENLSCVIVFVMVYYFLIAGMVWFVIFSYAWHMSSLQALGKIQERVDKKRSYFHLIAWSIPLVLTITTMAIGEIDGDYVTGICFVGSVNLAARYGLLLAPLVATMLVSGYLIIRGLILLVKVKIDSKEIISEHSSRKIRSNIVRMGVFTVFMVCFCLITFGYHHYIATNSDAWESSLQNFIMCKLTSFNSDFSHCKQTARPSVAMLQLQLLAVFGAGIAMASWVWCNATFHVWGRYIRRKFDCEVDQPMKLQKHRIIAQAFAKRKKFNEGGRISILFQHTDPVGLHFDPNSAVSNDLSTTWAANLPKLMHRRGAIPNDMIIDSYSSNNQSIDSEVSLNVRHVSIESRRNSGDSQLSVQIAELKATRKVNKRRHPSRANRRQFRNKRRNLSKSSTSLDSHFQLMNALTNTDSERIFEPNLKRRAGNAGLDAKCGKLVINRRNNNGAGGVSEDENVSVTISESRFNLILSNPNTMDLNDILTIKSLHDGVHIEELSSSDSDNTTKKDYGQEKHYLLNGGNCSGISGRESKRSRVSGKLSYREVDTDDSFEDCELEDDDDDEDEVEEDDNGRNNGSGQEIRTSRQSKTSTDVAVQTNSYDLEMESFDTSDSKQKSKQMKTKENNKKYKSKYCGGKSSSRKKSDVTESLLKDKYKISVKKKNEIT